MSMPMKKKGKSKGHLDPYKSKLKPGYPKTEEGVAKTVPSPNYPRENFKK
jgi:hypothetical protein